MQEYIIAIVGIVIALFLLKKLVGCIARMVITMVLVAILYYIYTLYTGQPLLGFLL